MDCSEVTVVRVDLIWHGRQNNAYVQSLESLKYAISQNKGQLRLLIKWEEMRRFSGIIWVGPV